MDHALKSLLQGAAAMTADERSSQWIAELEEVDDMTPEELRGELEKMAREPTFLGVIAGLALTAPQFKR